jgi:hypothetical protein
MLTAISGGMTMARRTRRLSMAVAAGVVIAASALAVTNHAQIVRRIARWWASKGTGRGCEVARSSGVWSYKGSAAPPVGTLRYPSTAGRPLGGYALPPCAACCRRIDLRTPTSTTSLRSG